MDNPKLIEKLIHKLDVLATNLGIMVGLPKATGLPADSDKLSPKEAKKETSKAVIFSKVLGSGLKKLIDQSNITNIQDSLTKTLNNIFGKKKDDKEGGENTILSIFKNLSGIVGLVGLGLGIYYIVNSLIGAGKIDAVSALKSIAAIGAFLGLFVLFSSQKGNLVMASIAFAIFGATLEYVLLPLFKQISELDFETLLWSLAKMGSVMIGMGVMLKVVSELVAGSVMGAVSSGLALLALIGMAKTMDYLFESLSNIAKIPWIDIGKGLLAATATVVIFGGLITGLGALLVGSGGAGAVFMGAGLIAMNAIILTLDQLSGVMNSFTGLDANKLKDVGEGIKQLGVGLVAFTVGIVGGTAGGLIAGFAKFFGVDPVSKIKEFQNLDASKLASIGLSLLTLSDGLKGISNNLNIDGMANNIKGLMSLAYNLKNISSDINLSGIINNIRLLTSPLIQFTGALNQFSEAYSKLDNIRVQGEVNRVSNIKIESDNGYQQSILDMNKQNLEIQKEQLIELRNNNDTLKIIAQNIRSIGGSNTVMQVNGGTKSGDSLNAPNFTTKGNYLDSLKGMAFSLDS